MCLLPRKAQIAGAAEVLKNPDTQKIQLKKKKKLRIFEILSVAISEILGDDQVMNSVYYTAHWACIFIFV